MKFPLAFDATTSRAEFVRLLPVATGDDAIRETAEGFAGTGWSLRLMPIAPLEIGSVRLERHHVEIRFDRMAEAQQDAFLHRFARYYQRGGG